MILSHLARVSPQFTIYQTSPEMLGPAAADFYLQSLTGNGATAGDAMPLGVFATGGTQGPVHASIVQMQDGRLARARLTHLDEYAMGPHADDEEIERLSFSAELGRNVFRPVFGDGWRTNRNIHTIDPQDDPTVQAQAHFRFVKKAGGPRTVLLGIGRTPDSLVRHFSPAAVKERFEELAMARRYDSHLAHVADALMFSVHLAFDEENEPLNDGVFSPTSRAVFATNGREAFRYAFANPDEVPFNVRTLVAPLHPSSIEANRLEGSDIDVVVTMSLGAILCARDLVLTASGDSKALSLLLALAGPVTPYVPASALQLVPQKVTVFADDPALKYIPTRSIRRDITSEADFVWRR